MLDLVEFKVGDRWWRFDFSAAGTYPLTRAFDFWMAELAHDYLRLGVCFRAIAIMLQIPGAADYTWAGDEGQMAKLIQASDQNTLLNVLAQTLERLDAGHLMEQVPAPDYAPWPLPNKWQALIEKRAGVENGLLTLVAECLDVLVIKPGLTRIDDVGQQAWWQRWWSRGNS